MKLIELQPDVENMTLDDKSDHDFDAELVGTKLRALYENGWFERDIMYLNTNLLEYRVNFSDGSFDYINVEDINGVDIELL